MELHPTPESWRIALFTAVGAAVVAAAAVVTAVVFGSPGVMVAASIIVLAALATLVPALGTMSATVDADARGVTIRRLGRSARFAWSEVVGVRVIERRASVPDGTEYHWIFPSRRTHTVAIPCLDLCDGRVRELPALAAPASGPKRAAAREHAGVLDYFRDLAGAPTAAPAPLTRAV